MSTKILEKKKRLVEGHYLEFDGELIPLGDFFSVGRHPSNHLVFYEDHFVSQKHCRIEKKACGYVLKDLQSSNGTSLNGEPIFEAPLKNFDQIQVGQSIFKFRENLNLETGIPPEFYKSQNPNWQKDLDKIPAYGASENPILILGPSGSGKEFVARALHFKSPRAYSELVSINCSSFNSQLIESELFGHLEGAFTGATKSRKGAFQQAHGGTLLLDEIGDLPLDLQPKLLRVLENKEIRPVGSDKNIKVDVRILASTHKDLYKQVQAGKFREDLYYRLNALSLRPPSLVERLEDFESLIFYFARQHKVRFSSQAIKKLQDYTWPGNIRELKNLVVRASVIFGKSGVEEIDIPELLDNKKRESMALPSSPSLIKEMEKNLILKTLKANDGNQRQTARDLGIAKSTLHDKIKRYLASI